MKGISYRNFNSYRVLAGVTESSFPVPSKMDSVQKPVVIFIQTPTTNADDIWVGQTGVQSDGSAGGFLIEPGKNAYIPVNFFPELKYISATAGQVMLITYLDNQFARE